MAKGKKSRSLRRTLTHSMDNVNKLIWTILQIRKLLHFWIAWIAIAIQKKQPLSFFLSILFNFISLAKFICLIEVGKWIDAIVKKNSAKKTNELWPGKWSINCLSIKINERSKKWCRKTAQFNDNWALCLTTL